MTGEREIKKQQAKNHVKKINTDKAGVTFSFFEQGKRRRTLHINNKAGFTVSSILPAGVFHTLSIIAREKEAGNAKESEICVSFICKAHRETTRTSIAPFWLLS